MRAHRARTRMEGDHARGRSRRLRPLRGFEGLPGAGDDLTRVGLAAEHAVPVLLLVGQEHDAGGLACDLHEAEELADLFLLQARRRGRVELLEVVDLLVEVRVRDLRALLRVGAADERLLLGFGGQGGRLLRDAAGLTRLTGAHTRSRAVALVLGLLEDREGGGAGAARHGAGAGRRLAALLP